MQQVLKSMIEGLYSVFTGEKDEADQASFKEKLRVTLSWLATIVFCFVMLKLLIK